MRRRYRSLILLAALALAACGPEIPGTPPLISALPRELSPAEAKLIAANNAFAFTLLREVTAQTADTMPNLFVSPLSVAMALGMTYNGAAGTTAAAMQQTLHLETMTLPEVNDAYRALIDLLRGLDPRVRFQIANSIWYRQGLPVQPAFVDVNRTYFDALVQELDFDSPDAGRHINDWVSLETQGRIPKIVPDQLPEGALMYLINAIYFKGDWTQQFDKALTKPAPFRLADGSTVTATQMRTSHEVPIRANEDGSVLVVDLPYGGRAFSLTVVMPRDPARFDTIIAGLTAAQWDGWVTALDSASREVAMPKFRLENDLTLNGMLQALGMAVAFVCEGSERADFTGIFGSQGPCITTVKHKSFVDVNEEGTEAAAATSVGTGVTSVGPGPIVIDGPFLFALRENLSGTILFLGALRNPVGLN
jgi:serine protease inhibitor